MTSSFCTCAAHVFVGTHALLCVCGGWWKTFECWCPLPCGSQGLNLGCQGGQAAVGLSHPSHSTPDHNCGREALNSLFRLVICVPYHKAIPSVRTYLEDPRRHARTRRSIPQQLQTRNAQMPIGVDWTLHHTIST